MQQERIAKMAEAHCEAEHQHLVPENHTSHSATQFLQEPRIKRELIGAGQTWQGSSVMDLSTSSGQLDSSALEQSPPGPEVHVDESGFGTFHDSGEPSIIKHCNFTVRKPPVVQCKPLPDAFSPCEDIMGNLWLRTGVW